MNILISGHNDGNFPEIIGDRRRRSFLLVHVDRIQNGGVARLVQPPRAAGLTVVEQMLLLVFHMRDRDFINALILAFCLLPRGARSCRSLTSLRLPLPEFSCDYRQNVLALSHSISQ